MLWFACYFPLVLSYTLFPSSGVFLLYHFFQLVSFFIFQLSATSPAEGGTTVCFFLYTRVYLFSFTLSVRLFFFFLIIPLFTIFAHLLLSFVFFRLSISYNVYVVPVLSSMIRAWHCIANYCYCPLLHTWQRTVVVSLWCSFVTFY